jgi:5-methylcytosine-specific restriction endonuclease McrA
MMKIQGWLKKQTPGKKIIFMDIDGMLADYIQPEVVTLTKKSNSGSTSVNQVIYTAANPHIKSLAAGLLLKNELMLQDVDYLEDELWIWLEFRERYLKKQLALHGDLVCVYCGKPHLEIGGRTPKDLILNNKNPNLATIDHILALSEGGARYDENNLCVACKKCNGKKGSKPVEQFKKKIKI